MFQQYSLTPTDSWFSLPTPSAQISVSVPGSNSNEPLQKAPQKLHPKSYAPPYESIKMPTKGWDAKSVASYYPISEPRPPPNIPSHFWNDLDTTPDAWETQPTVSSNSSDSPTSQNQSDNIAKRNADIEAELTKQNLYKTEMCRSWMESATCRYGTKCQFAHGEYELRPVMRHPKYKTEICKTFHNTGMCPYGNRCRFVHDPVELRSSPPGSPSVTPENQAQPEPTWDDNPGLTEVDIQEIQRKIGEIKIWELAPDPVHRPAFEESDDDSGTSEDNVSRDKKQTHRKKGSRLPFFQKLRKKKH